LIVLFIFGSSNLLFSQNNLFNTTSIISSSLSTFAQAKFNKAKALPKYTTCYIVKYKELFLDDTTGKVFVDLPALGLDSLTFKVVSREYTDDKNYTWYGRFFRKNLLNDSIIYHGNLTVMSRKGVFFGQVTYSYKVYDFSALDDQFACICLNNESFPFVCGTQHDTDTLATDSLTIENLGEPKACTIEKLRILVLYTDSGAAQVIDINETAELGIQQIKQNYTNSQKPNGDLIELADVLPINYELSSNIETCQGNLKQDFINLTDEIIEIASNDQINADVVIIITNIGLSAGTDCPDGLTRVIMAEAQPEAFAFIDGLAATGSKFGMTHEFMHIMGGSHDVSPSNYTLPNGVLVGSARARCFKAKGLLRCTVLTQGGANCDRINFLSNPYVEFLGKHTGTQQRYNAERVNNHWNTVSSFVSNDFISDPGELYINNPADCVENPKAKAGFWPSECMNTPLTYQWSYSTNGTNYTVWGLPTTTSSFIFPIEIETGGYYFDWSNAFVKCKITDANGNIFYSGGTAWYYCDSDNSEWGEPLMAFPNKGVSITVKVLKNPSLGLSELQFDIDSPTTALIHIYDIYGRIVWNCDPASLSKGLSTLAIGNDDLGNGFYYVKIKTNTNFEAVLPIIITE
jgi:hypothetical protein